MTGLPRDVAEALERWRMGGLVSEEQAEALRADAEAHASSRGRRGFQYVLAATGASVGVSSVPWERLPPPRRSFSGYRLYSAAPQRSQKASPRPCPSRSPSRSVVTQLLRGSSFPSGPWAGTLQA